MRPCIKTYLCIKSINGLITQIMSQKHVVIIGLGGVGGYFGFKINQTNKKDGRYNISFIARGKTYDIIKEKGLTLQSAEHAISVTKPDAIYRNIAEISNPDLVFISVKAYDLENVCQQLSKIIKKNTILIPMMNGADIYDWIREILPNHTILPSCVYVASHIKEKGVVEHIGKTGGLVIGKDPSHTSEDIDWIVELLKNSQINFELKESSTIEIWTKFMFIASFGLVTAKHDSSIGAVCSDESQRTEARKIMAEIKLIADKKGVGFSEHIIEDTFQVASTFPSKSPTSLQLDVHSGKGNNELELFAGTIIKHGKSMKISTVFTESILLDIKVILNNY